MRAKTSPTILLMGVILLVGMLFGIYFQRSFGVGNLIRVVGVNYPTRTPDESFRPVLPTPLQGIPIEYQGELALFILAGQSNISGYAELPDDQSIDWRAFVFGNDYRKHR
jgi:hypothetical protein